MSPITILPTPHPQGPEKGKKPSQLPYPSTAEEPAIWAEIPLTFPPTIPFPPRPLPLPQTNLPKNRTSLLTEQLLACSLLCNSYAGGSGGVSGGGSGSGSGSYGSYGSSFYSAGCGRDSGDDAGGSDNTPISSGSAMAKMNMNMALEAELAATGIGYSPSSYFPFPSFLSPGPPHHLPSSSSFPSPSFPIIPNPESIPKPQHHSTSACAQKGKHIPDPWAAAHLYGNRRPKADEGGWVCDNCGTDNHAFDGGCWSCKVFFKRQAHLMGVGEDDEAEAEVQGVEEGIRGEVTWCW